MKICTLQNENICTLRNEELLFSYNHDHDTYLSILSRHSMAISWCLENAGLKTWDRGQEENNFSGLVCRELLRRN